MKKVGFAWLLIQTRMQTRHVFVESYLKLGSLSGWKYLCWRQFVTWLPVAVPFKWICTDVTAVRPFWLPLWQSSRREMAPLGPCRVLPRHNRPETSAWFSRRQGSSRPEHVYGPPTGLHLSPTTKALLPLYNNTVTHKWGHTRTQTLALKDSKYIKNHSDLPHYLLYF